MPRLLLLLFLAGWITFLTGCAETTSPDPNQVSTIPWNRPEKWEGKGPLGGFSPNSQ
ncbi:MAG: hypothetical protein NTX04_12745 [Verrucomicrobia bacterium]|nr:hypothetical protein [Verrucomicrobiota bacterium]